MLGERFMNATHGSNERLLGCHTVSRILLLSVPGQGDVHRHDEYVALSPSDENVLGHAVSFMSIKR
jgi:hypothetical protein